MTGESALRALAGAAAMLGGRALAPWRLAGAGLLLGAAIFGLAARPMPSPAFAAFLGLVLAALLGLVYEAIWPPLVAEAALATLFLGLPAAVAAAVPLRSAPIATLVLGAAAALAGVSLFGACAALANAEAGWRRAAHFGGALVLPALAGAGAAWAASALPARDHAAVAGGAVLGALLAWVPPTLLERARAGRELEEEVRLGFLPAEDLAVLQSPLRRRSELRFGRADERKEYVRAALLLSVARQQQRRRSGEAIRLRQLEVLSFRTRMRRALEVRAERARRLESAADDEALG